MSVAAWLNVDLARPDFRAAAVAETGAVGVRFPLWGTLSPTRMTGGLQRWGVVVPSSVSDWGNPDAYDDFAYGWAHLLTHLGVWNEGDGTGEASSTLPAEECNRRAELLVNAFVRRNPDLVFIAPAIVREPEYLRGINRTPYSALDAHIYGKVADVPYYLPRFPGRLPIFIGETFADEAMWTELRRDPRVQAIAPFWHSPPDAPDLGIRDNPARLAAFRRLAHETGGSSVPPKYAVGPGVQEAMASHNDEPRGNERYISDDFSLTAGKKFAYLYSREANQTYLFPSSSAGVAAPPAATLPAIVDLRGKLPTAGTYEARPVSGLVGVTLHYTAGPASQTPQQIAAYQTSSAAAPQTGAGVPFPGIAYTYIVDGAGVPYRCWDLGVRTWHSAAPGRNAGYVGVCFIGNAGPTAAQLRGLAACIREVRGKQPAAALLEGHRDAPYATSCPGPQWPGWRPLLETLL